MALFGRAVVINRFDQAVSTRRTICAPALLESRSFPWLIFFLALSNTNHSTSGPDTTLIPTVLSHIVGNSVPFALAESDILYTNSSATVVIVIPRTWTGAILLLYVMFSTPIKYVHFDQWGIFDRISRYWNPKNILFRFVTIFVILETVFRQLKLAQIWILFMLRRHRERICLSWVQVRADETILGFLHSDTLADQPRF